MLEEQKKLCCKYHSEFTECCEDEIVGIALHSLDQHPLHGVRTARENGTCGWYIWGGEYSDDEHFYQPIHYKHVHAVLPQYAIPFLGLSVGFRFMCDSQGFEDVWKESQ